MPIGKKIILTDEITYSSFNLCFFGCRTAVAVDEVTVVMDNGDDDDVDGEDIDEDEVEIDVPCNVDEICGVDGCKGKRVRFLCDVFVA